MGRADVPCVIRPSGACCAISHAIAFLMTPPTGTLPISSELSGVKPAFRNAASARLVTPTSMVAAGVDLHPGSGQDAVQVVDPQNPSGAWCRASQRRDM